MHTRGAEEEAARKGRREGGRGGGASLLSHHPFPLHYRLLLKAVHIFSDTIYATMGKTRFFPQ